MLQLVLATGNLKKLRELEDICGTHFTVRSLADVGLADLVIVEDGATFAANAFKKAYGVLQALPKAERARTFAVLADDSGIVVDALLPLRARDPIEEGRPGIRSARFAADAGLRLPGRSADAANNALLLALLGALPDAHRRARFVASVCAIVVSTGRVLHARGTVEGSIAHGFRGAGGFGYDPLFVVADAERARLVPMPPADTRMAELSAADKHSISHRGRALAALLPALTGPAVSVFARALVDPAARGR